LDTLNWRKASHSSSSGGECVEVADHDGTVLVRDTKQHGHGQVHAFTPGQWRAFVATLKSGG
jgi:hypothetical protein